MTSLAHTWPWRILLLIAKATQFDLIFKIIGITLLFICPLISYHNLLLFPFIIQTGYKYYYFSLRRQHTGRYIITNVYLFTFYIIHINHYTLTQILLNVCCAHCTLYFLDLVNINSGDSGRPKKMKQRNMFSKTNHLIMLRLRCNCERFLFCSATSW